jgi:hypothetical protein
MSLDHPFAEPTAIRTHFGAIFVSLELSRSNWLITSLSPGGGEKMSTACARQDTGRFNAPAMNEAFYATTQTYGLPIVHPEIADKVEDVGALAPEAGNLLTAAFPKLSLEEANRILTETEGPGGGFFDDGSAFGIYSRLNLYAAAGRAAALSRAKP